LVYKVYAEQYVIGLHRGWGQWQLHVSEKDDE
jgi:hypothetical protein